MRHVTIRQLQVFVEAAELLSLARVAERLHLTPSAVSFAGRAVTRRPRCRAPCGGVAPCSAGVPVVEGV